MATITRRKCSLTILFMALIAATAFWAPAPVPALTVNYVYDARNQLTQATYIDNGCVVATYHYM